MKFLLGNKLHDLCHDTLCFLGFQVRFVQSFDTILMKKKLKHFFNWGSSFWLTLYGGFFFFKFLSVNFISANLGAVFDLEIPSWLLLDTKRNTFFFPFCFSLSCEKGFGNGLEGLPVQSVQEIFFLDVNLYFALVYLFHYYCLKNFWRELIYYPFECLISLNFFFIFTCYL